MTDVFFIGILAGVLQFIAYLIYAFFVVRAETAPNGMSWLMWGYGTFVFFFIELDIGAPLSVLFLPFVCMMSSLGIALYSFIKSAYIPPEKGDYYALSIDIILLFSYLSLLFLIPSKENSQIGIIFLILTSLSTITTFYPILRTTYLAPGSEKPTAWFIWTVAYCFLLYTVFLENMSWHYLIYPILNIILHALVGILAFNKKERTSS